jgi:Ni,Fe-hydrogenase III large subunit
MQVVRTFSDDILVEFGPDTFAKFVVQRGNLIQSQNLIHDFNSKIQEHAQVKTYMYLGTEESEGIKR